MLLFLSLKGNFERLDSKLALFSNGHVGSGGGEAFAKLVGIVTLHGHADPRELHPNPSLVVVVGGWLLIQLELLYYGLCVEVLEVFKVLGTRFLLLTLQSHLF